MTEMVATNKRVISKTGVISVKTEEIKNKEIESVEVRQSIIGRILNYADLHFSGTGTSKIRFKRIKNPREIKQEIENIS